MNFTASNLKNMLSAISQGNHVLNENVDFYRNTKTPCTACAFDPIRKESVNPDCQTCGGTGFTVILSYQRIPASVEQLGDFSSSWENVGQITMGQAVINVDIQELNILNINPIRDLTQFQQMKDFTQQFDYLIWNGTKFIIENFEAGWLEGNLYEIALTCKMIE